MPGATRGDHAIFGSSSPRQAGSRNHVRPGDAAPRVAIGMSPGSRPRRRTERLARNAVTERLQLVSVDRIGTHTARCRESSMPGAAASRSSARRRSRADCHPAVPALTLRVVSGPGHDRRACRNSRFPDLKFVSPAKRRRRSARTPCVVAIHRRATAGSARTDRPAAMTIVAPAARASPHAAIIVNTPGRAPGRAVPDTVGPAPRMADHSLELRGVLAQITGLDVERLDHRLGAEGSDRAARGSPLMSGWSMPS